MPPGGAPAACQQGTTTGQGQLLQRLKTNKTWSCTALTFRGFHIHMYMHIRTYIYISPLAGTVGLMVRRKLNLASCLFLLGGSNVPLETVVWFVQCPGQGQETGSGAAGRALLWAAPPPRDATSIPSAMSAPCQWLFNIPSTWRTVGPQYRLTMSEEGCCLLGSGCPGLTLATPVPLEAVSMDF